MSQDKKIYTTGFGAPVDDDINSKSAGSKGPLLLQDAHLLEKLSHFDRERIPERVVHAKGAGAHGILRSLLILRNTQKLNFFLRSENALMYLLAFPQLGERKDQPMLNVTLAALL